MVVRREVRVSIDFELVRVAQHLPSVGKHHLIDLGRLSPAQHGCQQVLVLVGERCRWHVQLAQEAAPKHVEHCVVAEVDERIPGRCAQPAEIAAAGGREDAVVH